MKTPILEIKSNAAELQKLISQLQDIMNKINNFDFKVEVINIAKQN
jgi:hypothetical protein